MSYVEPSPKLNTAGPLLLAAAYVVLGVALLLAVLGEPPLSLIALALDIPLFLAGGLLATRGFQRAHARFRGAHGAAGGIAAVAGVLGALLAVTALLTGSSGGGALSITSQVFPAASALFGALAALALAAGSYPPGARTRARIAASLLALGALFAATFTVLTFALEALPTLVYVSAFGAPIALALGLVTVALAWRTGR